MPELADRVGLLVDLAADFRLRDPALYPAWYGEEHHAPELLSRAVYGLPEVARAGKSEEDCSTEGIPYETGRCELGTTPRGLIAGQEGLLKLVFHGGTGVLLGVHAICEIASEIAGTGTFIRLASPPP